MRQNNWWILITVFLLFMFPQGNIGKETERNTDMELLRNLEKFVVESAKTEGNFTTLSVLKWQNDVKNSLSWTIEEIVLRMADAFDRKHPLLRILSVVPAYELKNKGYTECSYLLITHEPKSSLGYRR